jgi:hypothetical protein
LLPRRLDGAVRIIVVRHGSTEYAHDVIADMPLDGADIARDRAVYGLEEAPKNAMGFLGISPIDGEEIWPAIRPTSP